MSLECPGCAKAFLASGLSNHLSQTCKPKCIAAHDAAHHSQQVPSQSPPSIPDNFDINADPVPFEGDYFGSYTDADFANCPLDPGNKDNEDNDNEDDHKDDLLAEVEMQGWEPLPHSLAAAASSLVHAMDDTPDNTTSNSSSNQHTISQQEHHVAEMTIQKNTFVVLFPLNSAGAPIPPKDCSSKTHKCATYKHYQACVNGTTYNPYAPFTSY